MLRTRTRPRTFVLLVSAASAAAVVMVGLAGCRPKEQPPQSNEQRIQPAVMKDTDERMSELQKRAGELSDIVRRLPGRDVKEDRQLVAQAFDATADALTMMAGPEPGGAMRQQLRIIENIRQFLRTADENLSQDPAIDAGLRAAHHALDGIRERLFPTDEKVRALVNDFGQRLGELDHVRGPMHAVVVAQVFQTAATAIDTMGGILNTRNEMVTQAPPSPAAAAAPARAPEAPAPTAAAPAAAPASASAPPTPAAAPPAPAPTAGAEAAPAAVPPPAPPAPAAPPPAPAPDLSGPIVPAPGGSFNK